MQLMSTVVALILLANSAVAQAPIADSNQVRTVVRAAHSALNRPFGPLYASAHLTSTASGEIVHSQDVLRMPFRQGLSARFGQHGTLGHIPHEDSEYSLATKLWRCGVFGALGGAIAYFSTRNPETAEEKQIRNIALPLGIVGPFSLCLWTYKD